MSGEKAYEDEQNYYDAVLAERALEAAENIRCTRCQVKILEEESALGAVHGTYRTPIFPETSHFTLCGKCGLVLREFLLPELEFDAIFLDVKAKLMEAWA